MKEMIHAKCGGPDMCEEETDSDEDESEFENPKDPNENNIQAILTNNDWLEIKICMLKLNQIDNF